MEKVSEGFGDLSQSGFCDNAGEYAEVLGGHVQKGARRKLPEGHGGTTSITTSCAVSSLELYASCCFSLRVWMSFLALLRSLGKIKLEELSFKAI